MNFWDERFSGEDYIYGTRPNEFFLSQIDLLVPGSILLPGEGEGRNACYAASLGWEVTAFDSSKEGMRKALELARKKDVRIQYELATFQDYQPKEHFDIIAPVFTHMNPDLRKLMHKRYFEWLRPGGKILLIGFRKEQLGLSSGGPKNLEMLFSRGELEKDFENFTALNITEFDDELDEGEYHKGMAKMIAAVGIK